METIILQQTDPAVLEVATLALAGTCNVIPLQEIPYNLQHIFYTYHPKLIILDFVFDGRNARHALARVRKLSTTIPIVAMSCNPKIEEQAKACGFNGCVKKPFDLDDLNAVVDIFLRKNRRTARNAKPFCIRSAKQVLSN